MPIRGSSNGAAHSLCTLSTAPRGVDVMGRNRWTPSLGKGGRHQSVRVDAINRIDWSPSLGAPTLVSVWMAADLKKLGVT